VRSIAQPNYSNSCSWNTFGRDLEINSGFCSSPQAAKSFDSGFASLAAQILEEKEEDNPFCRYS